MNKNIKIITINGIRGALIICFIIAGLIAGFIISPSFVCMKLWNMYISSNFMVPQVNMYQGILLWFVIVLSLYALNGKKSLISFSSCAPLSKEQIENIIKRAEVNSEYSSDNLAVKEFEEKNNAFCSIEIRKKIVPEQVVASEQVKNENSDNQNTVERCENEKK